MTQIINTSVREYILSDNGMIAKVALTTNFYVHMYYSVEVIFYTNCAHHFHVPNLL
jgi:hypothetical protein